MPALTATIETTEASRLINRLCKHFSHKTPAQWDAAGGKVTFVMGQCQLEATPASLRLTCRAESADALQAVGDIVGSHLIRFANGAIAQVVWAEATD
ncbi:MAG: DUF2218 domain-containing protein [Marinobacter sp.]|nr:DUF2218 domain-containing protein [Marinobacter sp.]